MANRQRRFTLMKKLLRDRVMDIFDKRIRDRLDSAATVTLVGQRMPLRLLGTGCTFIGRVG
jgi:hypothetical protein